METGAGGRARGRARARAGARAGPSCVCILRMENIVAIFVPSPVQSELFEVSDTKGQAYMFMYEQWGTECKCRRPSILSGQEKKRKKKGGDRTFSIVDMGCLTLDPLENTRKLLVPQPRTSRRRIPLRCQCDPAANSTNQKIQSMQQNANAVSHDLDTQSSWPIHKQ